MSAFNPSNFGFAGNVISVENLVNARLAYEKFVSESKDGNAKTETPKLENENDQALVEALTVAFRRWVFSTLDDAPIVSTVLPDVLGALAKDVKDFRSWFVADATRKGVEVPAEIGAKEIAEDFQAMILGLFQGAKYIQQAVTIGNTGIEIGSAPMADFLPAEWLKREKDGSLKRSASGDVIPNLSRPPYASKGVKGAKKVGGYFLRYRFYPDAVCNSPMWFVGTSMQEIPAGTYTDEIAMKYVGSPTYRVTSADVFYRLPHKVRLTEKGRTARDLVMPEDGTSVFTQFNTGVLESWLPVGTEVEVEDDDDDDTDDDETEEVTEEETETV